MSMMMTNNNKDYRLAIISNCPIERYLKKGYDYVFSYYNPLGFFKTVHFFEPYRNQLIPDGMKTVIRKTLAVKELHFSFIRSRILNYVNLKALIKKVVIKKTVIRKANVMEKQYTLCIHRILDYEDVRKVFVTNKIDCIRIYEMSSFDLAKQLSEEFEIRLVVSIH